MYNLLDIPLYCCCRTMVKMSDAIDDPVAYTRLTDNIVQQILASTDPKLHEVHIYLV